MNTDDHYSEEARVAEDAAREAGQIIISLYNQEYEIKEKGKGHPVTTADLNKSIKVAS